ncbi:trk system potassium uptake protein TrkA [Breznakia sp. PF5-3]|uniref:potassium channel family protein n=1 Tax=unclassified Breznakia TaxID=2623764 RepID=UPI0024060E6E|nr:MULTISPECIES: TrkA family potassium uptake protein [unclassified Breznakia]MDL2276606.1 TrkA family potassium uptake protein [Breznakia sp. OttesenSCG-928-G09]MDF9824650.1 trk system potassium uptake protein TrkA [Breznakia sp. PM6-1]MDF9835635.1 trk system potassium uptake protein TrkA [Breznakia sp. PF5-3]MDF9837700.1 trk system potassium uptake protein TrkA [Breznakia sp. PFB2-8]MDF9859564.1 trk system potassium uptake protein TrkA [Breznakia sp. PH5-24]
MKVIVIGGGQVGSYVASILLKHDCEVKIIENRKEILKKLKNEFAPEMLIEGDGTDPVMLEEAGIANTECVVAVTGADEVNLVASTITKYEYGIERVIARVNHPKNEWLFTLEMGVDVKVNQAELLARLVVDEIDLKNILTLMKINRGDYSIVQMNVSGGSKADGAIIKDLDIPEKFVFISIIRNHEVLIPKGDTKLQSGDNILALTDSNGQKVVNELLG